MDVQFTVSFSFGVLTNCYSKKARVTRCTQEFEYTKIQSRISLQYEYIYAWYIRKFSRRPSADNVPDQDLLAVTGPWSFSFSLYPAKPESHEMVVPEYVRESEGIWIYIY